MEIIEHANDLSPAVAVLEVLSNSILIALDAQYLHRCFVQQEAAGIKTEIAGEISSCSNLYAVRCNKIMIGRNKFYIGIGWCKRICALYLRTHCIQQPAGGNA